MFLITLRLTCSIELIKNMQIYADLSERSWKELCPKLKAIAVKMRERHTRTHALKIILLRAALLLKWPPALYCRLPFLGQ